jgi:TPR repeat protein
MLITTSGSVSAQTAHELRAMYFRGDIVRMEEIARASNVRAEAWMGLMLQNKGRRLEAKVWWRRAAEKGDPWAISSLAAMHLTDKEDEEAVRWYKRGAELGELDAQNTYAWLLLQGRGVDKDEQAAAREYLAAALRGHGYSILDVAKLYASGTGVTRDPVEAYAFAY